MRNFAKCRALIFGLILVMSFVACTKGTPPLSPPVSPVINNPPVVVPPVQVAHPAEDPSIPLDVDGLTDTPDEVVYDPAEVKW